VTANELDVAPTHEFKHKAAGSVSEYGDSTKHAGAQSWQAPFDGKQHPIEREDQQSLMEAEVVTAAPWVRHCQDEPREAAGVMVAQKTACAQDAQPQQQGMVWSR
jgi:hypothetical protein